MDFSMQYKFNIEVDLANAVVATVLGSILATSDTAESEGRQTK